mmetsp:Transcript_6024/g.11417  ORF Transcript_6024/g.11417 Transcript_6024/m.11417 type:complete len:409 (+) Transcript_6024:172-1398(+)
MSDVVDKIRPLCNGYICLYSCVDEFQGIIPNSSQGIQQFVMEYDYEIYTSINMVKSLPDSLAEIESRMLSITSTQMGVVHCDLEVARKQFLFGNSYDWIYNDLSVDKNDAIIASIASAPSDYVDKSKAQCTDILQNNVNFSTCFPIKGSLKIAYYGEKRFELDIVKSMLNLVERGANEDWFTTDDVIKIVYKGMPRNSPIPSVGETIVNDQDMLHRESDKVLSGAGIGIIVSAFAAIVLGVAFLVKKTYGAKKKVIFQATPSPNAGKRNGLRAYDSECIRSNFDDEFLQVETPKRGTVLDPYETKVKEELDTTVILDSNWNRNKVTCLSTISEGSKETASTNTNQCAGMGSPPAESMQSFSRILSESTYSDGIHGLGMYAYEDDEYEDDGTDCDTLYGTDILKTPPPK